MNMSLYHIDQELENLIDQETGEVLDFDAFEALQMAWDAKIEGVLCWTKNLAAEAKATPKTRWRRWWRKRRRKCRS